MAERRVPEPSQLRDVLSGVLVVDARGVRKTYEGGVRALRDVDLMIAKGELIAVTGPSGSGKTTLLNCLAGLDEIDAGEITIEGKALAKMNDNQRTDMRARSIGFVFQGFNLLPMLTAEENVELPLLIAGESGRSSRRRAREALTRVGLDGLERRRPAELSGGEQQRVAIARGVVHSPALLFADEPTGALDSETSRQVMDLLIELNTEGQTIVLVTHNKDIAARAGRVVRMSDGQVIA